MDFFIYFFFPPLYFIESFVVVFSRFGSGGGVVFVLFFPFR